MQRVLLLAGLVWISLGIGVFAWIDAMLVFKPSDLRIPFPPGFQYVGVGPVAIGISHLIVYFLGKSKET